MSGVEGRKKEDEAVRHAAEATGASASLDTWLPSPSPDDLDLFGSSTARGTPQTRVDGFLLLVGERKGLAFRNAVQRHLERWLCYNDGQARMRLDDLLKVSPPLITRFVRLVDYASQRELQRQAYVLRLALCSGPSIFAPCKEILSTRSEKV